MDAQHVLMAAGATSLLLAGGTLVGTVRYAVVHDVRGVADDLSGRRRLRDLEKARQTSARGQGRRVGAFDEPATEVVEEEPRRLDGMEPATEVVDTLSLVREQEREEKPGLWFEVRREIVLCGSSHTVEEGGVLQ